MKAIIGKKVGMSQIFDENGKVIPVTVIEAGPCTVVQKKTVEKEGYAAVQLGYEDVPERKLTKPEMGHLNKASVGPKKYLREFDLENAAELNIGDVIKADTFKEGDFVDVTGTSKGHGYQGPIKRHGAQRTPMSHGGGPVHRHAGSMGSTTDPSRIFKGHIGAGQMGCDQVTIQNLDIVKVDPELNLIAVRGAIPGPKGGLVLIKSTVKTHRVKNVESGISNNPQKASGRNPQSALTRAEVSGGGKKPWRQKGTGHARQGSTRAPQWTHGGIVFAPKPRSYSYVLNKKVKRLAMKSALSAKAAAGELIVIDSIQMESIKTKDFRAFLSAVKADGKSLVVTPVKNENVIKSARNIPGVETAMANLINVYDILKAKYLVLDKEALAVIEEVFA